LNVSEIKPFVAFVVTIGVDAKHVIFAAKDWNCPRILRKISNAAARASNADIPSQPWDLRGGDEIDCDCPADDLQAGKNDGEHKPNPAAVDDAPRGIPIAESYKQRCWRGDERKIENQQRATASARAMLSYKVRSFRGS